jgi:Xaa-Pro dipeptidase
MVEEPFVERCQKAAQVAADLGAAVLIASDPSTVRWLTGRSQDIEYGPLYPFSAGTLVVLHTEGGGSIICPEDDSASGPQIPGLEVKPYTGYSLEPLQPFENAARLLKTRGTIAIEAHACSALFVRNRRWVDASDSLRALRVVKDAAELSLMRNAAKVVSAGQRAFRATVKPGLTEIEVFSQVHAAMEQAAGRRVPVLVDLMSGERVVEVGRPPTNRMIKPDELVLCDLLARVDGYWVDSCTTLSAGHADDACQRIHDVCRRALNAGIQAARPGLSAGELDRIIRSVMTEAGYAYPHHSGHGLGVSFHEEPRIVPSADIVLQPGMVIALEPAGFLEQIGARVEHMLEITDSGANVLTEYDLRLN